MKLLMQLNNKHDPSPNGNLNINYKISAEQLQYAKSKHMPKTIRRFNQLKQKKKEKWVTNELLAQIVRKNIMYVEWKTTLVKSADHEQIKLRFKNYENKVRNAIQETNQNRIFTAYINATFKKHG